MGIFSSKKSPKAIPVADWNLLRQTSPISRVFGTDRGQPIDRYYIENFLHRHAGDIAGRVLEVGAADYTRQFGGAGVLKSDVLHAAAGDPNATIIGDLSTGHGIPQEAFDCLLLTQVFPFIYDIQSAAAHSRAALKPGGVLLATFPGISQISRFDMERWGDFWRFTNASVQRLFENVFGVGNVTVETHGNVLAACAFLHGLAAHELTAEELDHADNDYQLIITLRAIRKEGGS